MTRNLRVILRLIWLLSGGGFVLFFVCLWVLDRSHPGTPANELITRRTIWIFLPPALLVLAGSYVSLRYWRCPHCLTPLRTMFPVPRDCPRCGRNIGLNP